MYKINKTHNHKYISFNAVLDYINIQILRTLRQMINIINTLVVKRDSDLAVLLF